MIHFRIKAPVICLLAILGTACCTNDTAEYSSQQGGIDSVIAKQVRMNMLKTPVRRNGYSFNTYGIDLSIGKMFLESTAYRAAGDSESYYCNFTYDNAYGNRNAIVYVSNANTISFGDFDSSSGYASVTTTSDDWSVPEYVGIQAANIASFITNGETLSFTARPLSYDCRLKIKLDNYDTDAGDVFVVTGASVSAPKATYNLPTPSECGADGIYAGNSSEGYYLSGLIASAYGWPKVLTFLPDYPFGDRVWSDVIANQKHYVSSGPTSYNDQYYFYPPLMHSSKTTYGSITFRLYAYVAKKGSNLLGSIVANEVGTRFYSGEEYDITIPTDELQHKHYYGGTTTYTLTLDFGTTSARPFGKGLSISDILPATVTVTEDD